MTRFFTKLQTVAVPVGDELPTGIDTDIRLLTVDPNGNRFSVSQAG